MGELRPSKPRLYLDADASSKALHAALVERGHDVTRTPTDWMPRDASDEQQLLGATAHGRSLFTFNVRDFLVLARQYPRHGGHHPGCAVWLGALRIDFGPGRPAY